MPSPATNQATYETATGAPNSVAMMPAIAIVRMAPPSRTSATEDVRAIARDCHQFPTDQLTVPSVMTIHNVAFQGRFDVSIFPLLGFPSAAYTIDGLEYYGGVGFLKAGLASANAIIETMSSFRRESSPVIAVRIGELIA